MKKKIKKYSAPRYPIMAISFYKNREGTLSCKLTLNPKTGKELHNETLNMRLFGGFVAESNLLDKEDLKSIDAFCDAFTCTINSPSKK